MPDTDAAAPAADPFVWTSSHENDKVIAAFVAALIDMDDIQVDSKVEAGPMRYKYATLAAVLNEVRPKLAKHGLVLSQSPTTEVGVITTVFHQSGQWLRFPPLLIRPAGGTPQNVGSAISYSRRYSILSICNLATEDDDGHAASVAPRPPAASSEPDPRHGRIAAVTDGLGRLSPQDRDEIKAWAEKAGKKLSQKAMFEDPEWLSEVEGYLAVVENDATTRNEATRAGDEEPF